MGPVLSPWVAEVRGVGVAQACTGVPNGNFESSPFGFSKQFDDVHHQIWVSRDDCDQKNGMFLHRNEKLRPPVIREMSGQTPRGTFNRLEFWNAVPPPAI